MESSMNIAAWLQTGSLMGTPDGHLLLGWGKRLWQEKPALGGSRPQFYFPDFFLEEKLPWFEHEHTEIMTPQALIDRLPLVQPPPSLPVSWQKPSQVQFQDTVTQLKHRFATGELAKAVPFVIESMPSTMTAKRLLCALRSLMAYVQTNAAYPYGFWDCDEGVLGATPEVLFRMASPYCLETMACAGTRKAGTEETALLHDAKERHEHHLVIQGITESLSPYGKVVVGETKLLRLPSLTHLISPIFVELKELPDIEEMVRALHPTPALGAFPRYAGSLWLQEYRKKFDRKRYGAPVGYLLPKGKENGGVYVAIRNVQWDRSQLSIAAGCGIVPDSISDNEWAEVNLKINAIKEMLSL